jgi:hypothetical protein
MPQRVMFPVMPCSCDTIFIQVAPKFPLLQLKESSYKGTKDTNFTALGWGGSSC